MNPIVEKNVMLMLSNEKGGMLKLLYSESIGGNAQTYEGLTCGATNFHYRSDGTIELFENFQHVDPTLLARTKQGIFRIALDFKGRKEGIIEIVPAHIPGSAGDVIRQSAQAFNRNRGFTKGPYA